MEYAIRKIERHEIPRLVEMCESHATYENAAYHSAGKQQALERKLFGEVPTLFCYVVEVDKELVGYFSYTIDTSTWYAEDYLHLDCLYLELAYRGQKIGERIFDKLTELARKKDCVNIQWQTPISNEKAIRFYERMGGIGKEKMRFVLDLQY